MIALTNIDFCYGESDFRLQVDKLEIAAGTKTAIVGPSGSGKTTLLRLIAGISTPDAGEIKVGDAVVSGMDDSARRDFRSSQIGFVFQEFELIEYLNVHENILLPYLINRSMSLEPAVRNRANELADSMSLGDKSKRFVGQLSQGEKQRVAICRALISNPSLILADEPTGNLDPKNKTKIVDSLFKCAADTKATLLMVTHDHSLLEGFDRVIDFEQLREEGVA